MRGRVRAAVRGAAGAALRSRDSARTKPRESAGRRHLRRRLGAALLATLCLSIFLGALLGVGGVGGAGGAAAQAAPASGPVVPELVALRIKQVVLVNNAPAVLLVDEPEQRYLLMFIDFFMANAIRQGMSGPQLERPLTHDLIGVLLRRLGARLERITITELKDNTYYALISLQVNGERAEFDARPSDALAIAVRNETPIFAAVPLLRPIESGSGTPPGLSEPPPGSALDAPKGQT